MLAFFYIGLDFNEASAKQDKYEQQDESKLLAQRACNNGGCRQCNK
jgi:hypothetical protein